MKGWFEAGGAGGVEIERLEVGVDLLPVLGFVPDRLRALPWSVGFFALPGGQQQPALAELGMALADLRTADGIRVRFSSCLATATV